MFDRHPLYKFWVNYRKESAMDAPRNKSLLTMQHSNEQLIAAGYRRTSNKYGLVSRIDRPDWVEALAKHLRRAPADFYQPGAKTPAGNWCDHYRRCLSQDTLELGEARGRAIPSSNFDDTGYVDYKVKDDAGRSIDIMFIDETTDVRWPKWLGPLARVGEPWHAKEDAALVDEYRARRNKAGANYSNVIGALSHLHGRTRGAIDSRLRQKLGDGYWAPLAGPRAAILYSTQAPAEYLTSYSPVSLAGGGTLFVRGVAVDKSYTDAMDDTDPLPGETFLNTVPLAPAVDSRPPVQTTYQKSRAGVTEKIKGSDILTAGIDVVDATEGAVWFNKIEVHAYNYDEVVALRDTVLGLLNRGQ